MPLPDRAPQPDFPQAASSARWLLLLLVCLPLLFVQGWMLTRPFLYYDFHTYWYAGRLFLTGGHPYSEAAMFAEERIFNPTIVHPQMMLCPPWTLPFLAIVALLPFHAAQVAWFAASLSLNCASCLALWAYFGQQWRRAWIPLLVAITFIPMGGAEYMGQITPLILACLTAFLLLLKAKRQFAAGVLLVGLGWKPHLLYLVALAILLWIVQERQWKLLAGACAGYSAVTVGALLYNPNAFDYFHHTYNSAMATPCGIGWVLRSYFGIQHTWLQFVPTVAGAAWFLPYWRKNRRTWDWERQIPVLIVVSVASSPYCWYHDFLCILPSLIALAARGAWRSAPVLASYLGVQAILVLSSLLSPAWMGTASLLWIPFFLVSDAILTRRAVARTAAAPWREATSNA